MYPTRGKLFIKALLALTAVSVVPALLIGWNMLRVDGHILEDEILDKQRTVANRISSAISETVSKDIQFFSVFTSLHSDFESHPALDQEDFDYLRKQDSRIEYVGLVTAEGRILFWSGNKIKNVRDVPYWNAIVQSCIKEGQSYIGSGYTRDGNLSIQLGFPIQQVGEHRPSRTILLAETNLKQLNSILDSHYTPQISLFLLDKDEKIISYTPAEKSDLPLSFSDLQTTASAFSHSMQKAFSKLVKLDNGSQWLVSKAEVPPLEWTLFIQQPANIISKLLLENIFHSLYGIFFILGVLPLFIVAVSFWVLVPIVRPVKRLQEVAVRFEREDDYMPVASDLIIPNNEIGELCRVFLHMAVVLKERKDALAAANKNLEQRVQQRSVELEKATAELVKTERLAAIGQMASIISHEIRNPLAVISNAAKLIKTIQPPTEPKLIKQFAIIDQEINQANGIIGEVLGFARSRDMILSVIDLNSYLHDIAVSFPMGPHIRLKEEMEEESARLKIDVEEMKQAVRNLISNACESMSEGGCLTIGTRIGKKVACFFVADEGPGISPQLKEQIFAPFFTTKARGTGLGLAVVQKAVKRHKGKLFVHNRPEGGSVFEIYLKIYAKQGDTRYG